MTATQFRPTDELLPNRATGHFGFFVAAGVLVTVLVALAVVKGVLLAGGSVPTGPSPFAYPEVHPAPPLALIDQNEHPFDLSSFGGTPALVFFGYTHCPDVCPATIGELNQVLKARPGAVRIVFVTVDPERDTPAFLRDYMKYMPAGYVTLTGSAAEVRASADAWGVQYQREQTGSSDGYAVAHTANVYLVDGQGHLRSKYPFATPPQAMIDDLDRLAHETHT